MKNILTFILLLIFSISYADEIKIITKEIKDSSVELRYHTSASYPQLDGMKDNKIQKLINSEIYETLKKGINDFKKDMTEWDLSNIPKDFSSEMEYTYTSYTLNDELFSFAFVVYSYYAGSAHPNHWTISMNFDIKNGMKLAFKDLFNPKVKYLEKISTYCIKDLKLQGEIGGYEFVEEMLYEGAGPKDSNFMNFNILQKGLQISFDPYQVGPYVMGEHCVIIPYKALYEIINQEGVLSKFDY
jgi:hypothetical protein